MGTVWRVRGTLIPKNARKYGSFRYNLLKELISVYGVDDEIPRYVAYELPDISSLMPKWTTITFLVDFDGTYGTGQQVFDIFKKHCDKTMKDGTTIRVTSWEDAGGVLSYVKGEDK